MEPIELSEADYKQLRLQARRAIGRISERIHYVLLCARGYSTGQIAQFYQVDERTVTTWIERFRENGVEGLADHPRSGRPRKLSLAARLEAEHCLDTTPEAVGLERTTWTRRLLGWHLRERIGCALSSSSVVRLIGSLGFVWRRPKLTLKETDPQAHARKEAMTQAIRAHPQAPRLYADECDIHLLPTIRGQYQRRGQQKQVPTPGNNKKQPVFGFLPVTTRNSRSSGS